MCTLQYFRRKSNLNIFLTHLLSDNTHPPPNKKKKQNKKHTHTHTHKRRFPTTQFFQTMQLRCNVLLAGLLVMLLERVHAQRCCNSKDHMSGCENLKMAVHQAAVVCVVVELSQHIRMDADFSGILKADIIVQADVLVQPARVVRLFIQQPAQKKKSVVEGANEMYTSLHIYCCTVLI